MYLLGTGGLLYGCYKNHREYSQEKLMYTLWLIAELGFSAHLCYLNVDAAREGLNWRVFKLPLERAQRRRLAKHTAFHFVCVICAGILLMSASQDGEATPLYSAEAYMRLRFVEGRESTCTDQEQASRALMLSPIRCPSLDVVHHFPSRVISRTFHVWLIRHMCKMTSFFVRLQIAYGSLLLLALCLLCRRGLIHT